MSFLVNAAKLLICSLYIMYVVLCCIVYFFPQFHGTLIFGHLAKWPHSVYDDPKQYGVEFTSRNFYLDTDKDVKVGVWQMLPKSLSNMTIQNDDDFERILSESNHPIVIYLHGNSLTRTASLRVSLYNRLAEANHHVFALDYRGFADSTGTPCEPGVTHDSAVLYKWVKERAGSNRVFLWGHSLGAAIATVAAKELCKESQCPSGLVLESPFNNLNDGFYYHTLTFMFRWLPYFNKIWIEPLKGVNLHFASDERIKLVDCPILILHANDDLVVPVELAQKLHNAALLAGKDVTFIEFESKFYYNHVFIYSAPELPQILDDFAQKCHTGLTMM